MESGDISSLNSVSVLDLIKENMIQQKQHNTEVIAILKEQISHFKQEVVHKNKTIENLMIELHNYRNNNNNNDSSKITPDNTDSNNLIDILKNDIDFLKKELDSRDKIIELLLNDKPTDGITHESKNDDLYMYPKRTCRINYDDGDDNEIKLNNRFSILHANGSYSDDIVDEICSDDIINGDSNNVVDGSITNNIQKFQSLTRSINVDEKSVADANDSFLAINDRFAWQKHSSGIATKIMNKTGYKGKGLGKMENGITEPISIKPLGPMQHGALGKSNMQENRHNQKKKVLVIESSSMLNQMDENRLSRHNIDVKVRSHGGCTVKCMYTHLPELFNLKPDYIILHIGSNDCTSKTSDEVLAEINNLTAYITKELPYSKLIISLPIVRTDSSRSNKIQQNLKVKLQRSFFPCLDNSNVDFSHLGRKGLHLNNHGTRIMARNIISLIKRL